jgi:hypothetical protein
MKLNGKALALAAGILCGLALSVVTLAAFWRGSGQHLTLLSVIYFGYSISYLGSVIGLAYGFATGLLGGALFAWLYNLLAKREKKEV